MKSFMVFLSLTVAFFATAQQALADSCRAEIVTRRGRVVDSFREYSYSKRSACREAMVSCRRVLRRYQNNGRLPYAECEIARRDRDRRPPARRYVTITCSVSKYGARGRFLQRFTATETGREGTNVFAQACRKAGLLCQRTLVRRQYCQ